MSDIEFSYQTFQQRVRTGPVSRLLGWIGAHAARSGFVAGVLAVLVAMGSAWEGVRAAPAAALIISAVVVAAWTVLVWAMGSFFRRQALMQVAVRRQISAGPAQFVWMQDDAVLCAISQPKYRVLAAPMAQKFRAPAQSGRPWPVWLVVQGEDDARFVLETQVTRERALQYEEVSADQLSAVDEKLPTALALRLLNLEKDGAARPEASADS